mmetsp:Transcript_28/g.52  ORF Transcript_28/g.52 Transcript_28/m.52 type:complete len:209 (-) Transcript_28:205-831(-)
MKALAATSQRFDPSEITATTSFIFSLSNTFCILSTRSMKALAATSQRFDPSEITATTSFIFSPILQGVECERLTSGLGRPAAASGVELRTAPSGRLSPSRCDLRKQPRSSAAASASVASSAAFAAGGRRRGGVPNSSNGVGAQRECFWYASPPPAPLGSATAAAASETRGRNSTRGDGAASRRPPTELPRSAGDGDSYRLPSARPAPD